MGALNPCKNASRCIEYIVEAGVNYPGRLIGEYRLRVDRSHSDDFERNGWKARDVLDLLRHGQRYRQGDGTEVVVNELDTGLFDIMQFTADGVAQSYKGANLGDFMRIFNSNGWSSFP